MEEVLFRESKPIASALKNDVVEARLHTDTRGPMRDEILMLQEKLAGTRALPTFVLIDVETEEMLGRPAVGNKDEAQFVKFLNDGLKK